VVFRRQTRLLWMLGAMALMGIGFSSFVYVGSLRHFGMMYVAVVAGLWMMQHRTGRVSRAAYVLLGTSALAGLTVEYGQWHRPFADDAATAQWLRAEHLENAALIATPDANTIGVPELLDRPVYQLDCRCVDRFLKFDARRDDFDPERQVPERLVEAVHTLHAPEMVFLINRTLKEEEVRAVGEAGIQTSLLARFEDGDRPDEHFMVYRVSLAPRD
jgi:hypothetical protein